ncbi:MAG: CTP synthase [Christensenellaceae bacterium]|nr:CTP synthase [Christensenellaceae bacterium]PWL99982.1 MAG: CTP synthase [Selenomonadales bacterium]
MMAKYVFITGGVVSSLGKGITAASLGRLLKCRGLKVVIQKFDPYINVDPGTMNPYQHGEVFVTDDGAETDLDLGHYERFIDENLSQNSNVTTGRVYQTVIERERSGGYLGGTVQVIPHITNEIKGRILKASQDKSVDVIITEIGGTVGDIESQPFLEAIRQIKYEVGVRNSLYIHVTLVPYLAASGEIKTKPTQHSVKELLGLGIQPDIIVCRTENPIPKEQKDKIALFCNVLPENIIENRDVPTLYEVPLALHKEGLDSQVCKLLNMELPQPDLTEWTEMVDRHKYPKQEVCIALAGKYIGLHDAYLSVAEALTHGGIAHSTRVKIKWLATDEITRENVKEIFSDVDGILIPGGFGSRGIEGKIEIVRYARENNVPFLGICLGMQMAVIEYARNVLNLRGAHTTEVDPSTPYPVIDLMPDQANLDKMGGTMRLGQCRCEIIDKNSNTYKAYQADEISERHRHRYEFNNNFKEQLASAGMTAAGVNPERNLVEIVEIASHPWFVGVQFHPEFKSRPNRPHPLFRDLVGAAIEYKNSKEASK